VFASAFHAWLNYAASHEWYAAGVEVRREMNAAGYSDSLGDTWAVNEVGAPSGTQMGVDGMKDTGRPRQDLRDFVRGLATGDAGVVNRGSSGHDLCAAAVRGSRDIRPR
jgi:hypothetical protein